PGPSGPGPSGPGPSGPGPTGPGPADLGPDTPGSPSTPTPEPSPGPPPDPAPEDRPPESAQDGDDGLGQVPWPDQPLPNDPEPDDEPGPPPGPLEPTITAGADPTCRRTHWLSVPHRTLTGHEDLPGDLHRFGILTADQARQIATHARRWIATRTPAGQIMLHGEITLYGDPRPQQKAIAKAIATIDASDAREPHYRPSSTLAARVRARDGTCRWPSCNHSAFGSDLDHTRPYHLGGPTKAGNLSALHRRHHRIKGLPGMWLIQYGPGRLMWRTRTGAVYLTQPPNYDI
ncbi:MAG TPA: HNH endonuclease signature motif containing protein, partial [Propionibacteriaceae bacterium]